MSALCGVVGVDEGSTAARLRAMTNALHHQAVTPASYWQGPQVGLGVRLHGMTREDRQDHQPRVSSDGRWVVLFDGWLADRGGVLRRLGRRASEDLPDSVLAAETLVSAGAPGISHLFGGWAMAAWDRAERCLHLWRAPIDSPPLHYHEGGHWLAFASMPFAVHAAGVRRQWDEQKLADMLVLSPADPDHTLFAGIRRLATGTHLVCTALGRVQVEPIWTPDPDRRLHLARDADYLEAFMEVFSRATEDACRTAGRVGVSMSGGLDSTAVAAVAAETVGGKGDVVEAYTAHWPGASDEHQHPGWDANEVARAQAMADRHAPLRVHLVDAPESALDVQQTLFPLQERYVSAASNSVWMQALYTEARADGVTVLLTGQQGNLALTRSGRLDGALRDRDWRGAWMVTRGLLNQGSVRPVLGALTRQYAGWVARWRSPAAHVLEQAHVDATPINRAFARQHRVLERARAWPSWPPGRVLPPSATHAAELRSLRLQDIGAFHAPLRAGWGVETRTPATDVRVVEFCHALPDRLLCGEGFARGFVPAALGARLPAVVSQNRRRGEQSSDEFDRLFRERSRIQRDLERLAGVDLVARAIDLPRLRALVERWPSGRVRYEQIVPYRGVLLKGLSVAYFLDWWERGGNHVDIE